MTQVDPKAEELSGALTLCVFGGLKAEAGGRPLRKLHSPKGLGVLAYLALHPGPVHRPALAVSLWPGLDAAADTNLNGTLRDLRRALGEPPRRPLRLCSVGHEFIQLKLQPGDYVDALAFAQALEDAQQGSPDAWQRAVDLYSGPLLHGWGSKDGEGWVYAPREKYRVRYLSALSKLHTWAVQEQRYEDVLGYLRLRMRAGDKNETGWRELMEVFERRQDSETFSRIREEYREHFPFPSLAIRELWNRIPEATTAPQPALDLPFFFTQPFGRERLLNEIKAAITSNQTRFVVLTGTGGIGKTRLAVSLAQKMQGHFQHGITYLDLAPVSDPAAVVPKLCVALKTSPEQMTALLQQKEALLIFDNCEQLQDACAALIRELLASCPRLTVLAASRQAFSLGEVLWNVPGLEYPLSSVAATPEVTASYPACRLFLDRAKNALPSFRLTAANAGAVAELCRRLEGIPLALELVAAHLSIIPTAQELLAVSKHFLDLEISGGEQERHAGQTLRGVIGWSYDTLNDQEKCLLRRLSVFAGGWTRDAAGAVCLEAGEDVLLLGLLKSLMDKSLLVSEPGEEQSRCRLLETIRQFVADAFSEAGEQQMVRAKHRDWFLALAEAAEWEGAEQGRWLRRLAVEYENLRTALAWSVSELDSHHSLRLCKALGQFWYQQGQLAEGLRWCVQALECAGNRDQTPERAKTLYLAGRFALNQGDSAAAQAYSEESLTIYQVMNDRRGMASALTNLGYLALTAGDPAQACQRYEESLTLCREINDRNGIASALSDLAGAASSLSDFAGSLKLYKESLHIFQEIGNRIATANLLNNIGDVARVQGDLETAQEYLEKSLAVFQEIGDKRSAAALLFNLGIAAIAQNRMDTAQEYLDASLALCQEIKDPGQTASVLCEMGLIMLSQQKYDRADALYAESLDIHRRIGNLSAIAVSLHGLGEAALKQGNLSRAQSCYMECLTLFQKIGDRRGIAYALEAVAAFASPVAQAAQSGVLLGAAAALREEIKSPLQSNETAAYDTVIAAARQVVGDAEFEAAWARGKTLSPEEAAKYALSCLSEISSNAVS
jgi:predicted ATPase/DNA-binding SARP family transcriptional activator/Tfp pilus assembly protein PilF